eukprot:TRINITY_DN4120_c0_g2_i4.p1 TRINITY_DN4120_c0_g2~~TRINITY_DN4120_c0_g2_i4.p1  ORF type:complete len:287 (+),score=35.16 TRINITY_DN4120_c0_g2_i4:402-1262(+)
MHCMPTLLAGRMVSSGGATLYGALIRFRSPLTACIVSATTAAFVGHGTVIHPHSFIWFAFLCAFAYGVKVTRKFNNASDVWRPVGEDKVRAFEQYRGLYGECPCVFFGDNGQGDLFCGEQLALRALEDKAPHAHGAPLPFVSAVFIHEVIPRSEQLSSLDETLTDEEKAKEWQRRNIFFHKTYVGAAVNAYECQLISQEALSRVGKAAVEDFVRMRIDSSNSGRNWGALVRELNTDVCLANDILPESLQIALAPQSEFRKDMQLSTSMADFSFTTPPPRPEHIASG